ncbi:MAG: hypothetical protein ABFD51_06555 [Anaerolineaceae bacterium]
MSNHKTKNEIEFIKNLGKHNIHNENYSGPKDKNTLLAGYLKGIEKREKWGEIDKEEVMAFVLRN